jgi:hypothetical protein
MSVIRPVSTAKCKKFMMRKHQKVKSYIVLVSLGLVSILWYSLFYQKNYYRLYESIPFITATSRQGLAWEEKRPDSVTAIYRKCLIDKLKNKSKWLELHLAIQACLGETIWNMLDVKVFILSDLTDVKFDILPVSTDNFDCISVTLGVGLNIDAELELQRLLPKCKFYAAEPILSAGLIFKQLGTLFEIAVGAKNGSLTSWVVDQDEHKNNMWVKKTVPAVSMLDFLKHYVKVDHVDYLIMDNEGSEYDIFEQFLPGGVLYESGIKICQITVEFHGPRVASEILDEHKYDRLVDALIAHSNFLPFWSSLVYKPGETQIRSYYLNVKDDYCVKTFYKERIPNW